MSLRTDCLLIYIPLGNQGRNTRHHAIITTFSRVSIFIPYIRIKNKVTVTGIIMVIYGRAMRLRHAIAIQRFGIPFVKVNNHRIFFGRIKISRFINYPFKRTAVQRNPMNQFGSTPVETLLLGHSVSQLHTLGKIKIRQMQVRILLESLHSIKNGIRLFSF